MIPNQPGGGIFGSSNLFNTNLNNSQQQQQQQQPNQQPAGNGFNANLFNKPPAPLFPSLQTQQSNNSAPQPSIFGNSLGGQLGNQQSTLFGKPAPALNTSMSNGQGGMFGSSLGASTNTFNASTNVPGAQGTLIASISEPIGANLPIFSMLPPGPHAVNLDQSPPKKKVPFFVDVPTRSPIPRLGLSYSPAKSKLRGFDSSAYSSIGNGNPFASMSLTQGKPGVLSLSRARDSKTPDPFSSMPSLGSGSRNSVKKLILDKKVEPSELFTKSGGSPGSMKGKVVFSPALSIAARERDNAAAAAAATAPRPQASPTPAPRAQHTPNRFTATQNPDDPASALAEEGEYWVKPDLSVLKNIGYKELSSFPDLSVGRVGYGEIHFLEPVDLTGLPKLGALLGDVIRFDDKECSVYPDSDDVDKPPSGSGLNVPARISLVRCWAVDKATRQPIKDATHPSAVKHLKRLKNMKDTQFESFDIEEGRWTFSVAHF